MNIYQNTEDNSFNHSCNISGTQLLTKENLKQHHDKVPKNQEIKCIKCDHRVRLRSSLSRHIRDFHEWVKYPCMQCDHKATSKGNLAQQKKSSS